MCSWKVGYYLDATGIKFLSNVFVEFCGNSKCRCVIVGLNDARWAGIPDTSTISSHADDVVNKVRVGIVL